MAGESNDGRSGGRAIVPGQFSRTLGEFTVEISRPEKVFFPDVGITKGDLVEYYERIGETMLPHVAGRIVTMVRYPDGIQGKAFFQKDVPEYFPEWIRRVEVEKEEGTLVQLVIENVATLVYLAVQACITPHVWPSKADRRHHPDRMIFDLDPPAEASFGAVRDAARALRSLLDECGLPAFPMTTGSKGLHVVVPLDASADFEAVRDFARRVARVAVRRDPERVTLEQRKDERGPRIYLDVLRNAYAQHSVAPYAVRALPSAPVATPIDWDELHSRMHPQRYNVRNIFRRLGRRPDPWRGIAARARSLDGALEALGRLEDE